MVDRREFLRGSAAAMAATGGVAALGATTTTGCAPAPDPVTPAGPLGDAGIDHVVVVMMENRSFDHFLGWVPGADGVQEGLAYPDDDRALRPTWHYEGSASCQFEDPGHSYEAGRRQYHQGAVDGFLTKSPDLYPISYHEAADLPFWEVAAPAFTVCDRYFAATMAGTYPNRFYQHCGRTDRWANWLTISDLPTIWDRVVAAGLEGRYYFTDAPFAALLGPRHLLVSRTVDQFVGDCAAGRLPHVAYVDPGFLISPLGTSSDYHPPTDIRRGDAFLHRIYEAVTTGPGWERTVMIVNFDEWGGFYDHVVPAEAPDVPSQAHMALRGFRVPCLVVSPYARRGHVAHGTYDHASVLRMIEWGFGLEPLAARDAHAENLADVLDLAGPPDLEAPHWELPAFAPADCSAQLTESLWAPLRDLARAQGWPV